jgi:hypothetical protein
MVLIGKAEEQDAIQLEMSTWLRKRGDHPYIRHPEIAQPLHILPEDGNCNVCRNVG